MDERKIIFLVDSLSKYKELKKDSDNSEMIGEINSIFKGLSKDKDIKGIVKKLNISTKKNKKKKNKKEEKAIDKKEEKAIDKKENVKKKEKSVPYKAIPHKPYDTVNFLSQFSNHPDFKYTTHSWDHSREDFDYDSFIKNINDSYEIFKKKYSGIEPRTLGMIIKFLFHEEYDRKNKEYNRKNKDGWSLEKVAWGWSAKELRQWCKENPGKYPSNFPIPKEYQQTTLWGKTYEYPFFENIINRFKHAIEFRLNNFQFLINLKRNTRIWGVREERNLIFDDSLKNNMAFFIDVEKFNTGLKNILDPIKDPLRPYKDVLFSSRHLNDPSRIEFEILHKNSVVNLDLSTIDKESTGYNKIMAQSGNFESARRAFLGQCDWKIKADFLQDKSYQIDYLKSGYTENLHSIPEIESLEEKVGGFKHIITFYHPQK